MYHIITGQNQILMKFYVVQLFMESQGLTNSVRSGSDTPEVPSCPMPRNIAGTLFVSGDHKYRDLGWAGLRADNLSP